MKRPMVACLLFAVSLPLLAGMGKLPPQGSTDTPSYRRVALRYLERGAEEAGSENIVTDVILNYRGFDTNGEVVVIFASLVGVLGVLLTHRRRAPVAPPPEAVPVSPIVLFIVRTLAPFIALFSLFVILHGHVTPGGGFQGGTVLGSLVIALSLVTGGKTVRKAVPPAARPWLQAAAVLTFTLVGAAGLAVSGHYLSFPRPESLHLLRTAMILLLEAGIGAGGAAIVASLFLEMEAGR